MTQIAIRPRTPLGAPVATAPASGFQPHALAHFLKDPLVIVLWRFRVRTRKALRALDDAALDDIGLTRAEAESEAAKPFWRV